jgi:hypothetical protein
MKWLLSGLLCVVVMLELAAPAAAQAPRGTYMRTCRNIQFDGQRLSAVCEDISGRGRPTDLYVDECQGPINNSNGQLTCPGGGGGGGGYRPPPRVDGGYGGGRGYGGGLPPGSWRATCRDASLEGPFLVALCATPRGGFEQSRIAIGSCRSFANRFGRLSCE